MIGIVFMCVLVSVASGCDIPQKQTINIYRALPAGAKPLAVQCKFGNQALPPQTLFNNDQHFHFEICKSSQANTLSCTLVWGNKHKTFDAFQDLPNTPPILDTDWSANVNGLRLADTAGNMKFFPWD